MNMNKTIAISAVLIAVFLLGASSTQLTTRWMNDEGHAFVENKWREHCEKWGALSNNVVFGYRFDTNSAFAVLSDGTKVELGFRSDGVVVWRNKQEKE